MTVIIFSVIEVVMGRAFSEKEKKEIRSRLIDAGSELFSVYGMRKTSVDDIARKAGISKGAFYSFYRMKELLMWDVINRIEDQYRKKVMKMLSGSRLTKDLVSRFLKSMFEILDEQPLIKRLIEGSDYQELFRVLPEETLKAHLESDFDFSDSIIKSFIEAGIKPPGEPEAAAAMLRSLFFISLHKKEIGGNYPEGIALLCDITAAAFIYPEDN